METPEPQEKEKEQGIGPIAATLIIVLLVAAAGIYYLLHENQRFHTPPAQEQFNA